MSLRKRQNPKPQTTTEPAVVVEAPQPEVTQPEAPAEPVHSSEVVAPQFGYFDLTEKVRDKWAEFRLPLELLDHPLPWLAFDSEAWYQPLYDMVARFSWSELLAHYDGVETIPDFALWAWLDAHRNEAMLGHQAVADELIRRNSKYFRGGYFDTIVKTCHPEIIWPTLEALAEDSGGLYDIEDRQFSEWLHSNYAALAVLALNDPTEFKRIDKMLWGRIRECEELKQLQKLSTTGV